jgi:hypothetical protein
LAKLYGVSLDDLLDTDQSVDDIARNAKEQQSEAGPRAGSEAKASTSEEANPKEQEKATSSSSGTIHLEDGSDKVDIDLSVLTSISIMKRRGLSPLVLRTRRAPR